MYSYYIDRTAEQEAEQRLCCLYKAKLGQSRINSDGQLNSDSDLVCFVF